MQDKDLFKRFQNEIQKLCYSESWYRSFTKLIEENKDKDILSFEKETRVQLAVGFWYALTCSFSSAIGNKSFSYKLNDTEASRSDKPKRYFNRVELIAESNYFCQKLKDVQVFSKDANQLIQQLDTEETFVYADPPYFNADMRFYAGYTENNFIELLETLSQMRGKFLLSCYASEILQKYISKHHWNVKTYSYKITATNQNQEKSKTKDFLKKTEFLVYNYDKDKFIVNQ